MNNLDLCLSILENLSAHERAAVARKINSLNSAASFTHKESLCIVEGNRLCDIILDSTGLNIKSKSRDYKTISAKKYVCKVLRDKGFTFMAIGKALNIDHSTAIVDYNGALDAEKYPNFYPEYHDIKKIVEEQEEMNSRD